MINKSLKITLVSSFTVDPILQPLKFWLDKIFQEYQISIAPYNQVFQSIITVEKRETNSVYVIFLRIEDMYQGSNQDDKINYIEDNIDQLTSMLQNIATTTSAQFIIIFCPSSPRFFNNKKKCRELELKIRNELKNSANVTTILSSETKSYYKVRIWYNNYTDKAASIPYTFHQFMALGTLAARKIFNLFTPPIKVIAVDCDNTIWSGVCAEDRALGVKITKNNNFLQKFLKKQRKQGKLICLVSKNEQEDVWNVFKQNSDMILKRSDIVASKINWQKKSDNLVNLASELNLGLDSFLFIDDNPIECAEISSFCPSISVVNLPTDKNWDVLLSNIWKLDQKKVTNEDKKRGDFYKSNYRREELKKSTASFYDFIKNLNLKISFSTLGIRNLGRASQLSQRTNQFNLVANRYSEDDLQRILKDPNKLAFVVSAKDRFGDYGIIGFLICCQDFSRELLNIEGWFLSCRILGRGAEFSILTHIIKIAEEKNLKNICFNLKKTERNTPAQQFLKNITKNTSLSQERYVVSLEDLKRLQLTDVLVITEKHSSLQTNASKQSSPKNDVSLIELAIKYSNLDVFQKELGETSYTELQPNSRSSYLAAQTKLQKTMIKSLEEILNISPLGINDNFFELGVSSLQAMLFLGSLSSKIDLSIGLTEFFQYPSITQLASKIEQSNHEEKRKIVKPFNLAKGAPLSAEEQRMWVLQKITSNSCAYNVLFAQHLYGDIDINRLLKVIKYIQKKLNIFNLQFKVGNNTVFKHVVNNKSVNAVDVRLCKLFEIEHNIIELFHTVFNLEKAPLAKIEILIVNNTHAIFCFLAPHIIIDRWGAKLLFDLISDLYNGKKFSIKNRILSCNQEYLPHLSIHENELLDFWKKELTDYPEAISLPYDYPTPLVRSYKGGTHTLTLSEKNRQKIISISNEKQCSVFTVMLALFRAFIFRYSNQEDCTIGFPFANRENPSAAQSINLSLNTLIFRMKINEKSTLDNLIEKTKLSIMKILDKNNLPFDKLVKALNVNRSSVMNPLFQIMFVYSQAEDQPFLSLLNTTSEIINIDVGISKFDLTFYAHNHAGGIDLTFEYSTDLFEESTIKVMLKRFLNFIENATSNPDQLISQIKMFTSIDYKKFFYKYNNTTTNKNYNIRIENLFQKSLKKHPDKVAVIYNGKEFTYTDINDKANVLATKFLKIQQTLIGIFIPDVLDQAITSLAILKSGNTYVPLDVSSSASRINSMLRAANIKTVVTYKMYSHVLSEYDGEIFFLDGSKLEAFLDPVDNNSTNCSDLAYVIHTSGTTGVPKGVAMEHRSVSNTLLDVNRRFSIGEDDVCLAVSNFHFDLSVYDFYGIWAAGGTVVIPDNKYFRNPYHWIKLLTKYKVTVWNSVPALMQMLCDVIEEEKLEKEVKRYLKTIMLSGDKITISLLNRIKKIFPDAKIYSLGGATEAAIWSITYPLNNFTGTIIPYGYPLANQKIYVLNNFLELCPENVEGEIYIGGAGLARCYLNNPQENSGHFFIHPILKERLYRTGDLGKIDKTGLVWIMGRTDTQIKIRGYRIELGEINAILMNNPHIQDCVTIVKGKSDSEKIIISYYLSKASLTKDLSTDLLEYMKFHLPAHMVPNMFIQIDHWPLNSNGKVDIKALSEINTCLKSEKKTNAQTPTERCIRQIFENILNFKIEDITDNFFELGGHSLLIPKIIKEIKKTLGVELSFIDIYEQQSIVNIAHKVDSSKKIG